MSLAPLIEVDGLTVTLGKQKILDGVTFEIHPGEYVGVVGPNGGGKTTLLKAILGLIKIKQGSILINGKKAGSVGARKKIGYVPQHFATNLFHFPMTVEEVVGTGHVNHRFFGMLSKEDLTGIDHALEMVSAKSLKRKMFADLSGGQRQRVIIARALVNHPSILFLDEPLSAVDPPSQQSFYKLLSELNKKENLSVVMVTHDIEMVTAQASRVLCLNQKLHANCHTADLSVKQWGETFGRTFKSVHHHRHAA